MQSPFYKLIFFQSQFDFTDMCNSFTFEDSVKEDDIVVMNLTLSKPDILDKSDFQKGKKIVFQFGYIGGKKSVKHIAKISDIDSTFGKSITCKLTATDEGQFMKKESSNKIWTNKTLSQIAFEIAEKYGLDKNIKTTSTVYDSISQGYKTDFDFLKYLVKQETNGSYIFYIKNGVLNIVKRDLGLAAKKLYTWNDGNGTVISFKPSFKNTSKTGASDQTSSVYTDFLNKQTTKTEAKPDTSKENPALGKLYTFGKVPYNQNSTGKQLFTPFINKEVAKNSTQKVNKDASLNELTATLVIEGDPDVKAGDIITIGGVGKKFGGNWYATKVKHSIQSGYTTTIELSKNASDVQIETNNQPAKETNNSKGISKYVAKKNLPTASAFNS
jgi:uncharacterized protein